MHLHFAAESSEYELYTRHLASSQRCSVPAIYRLIPPDLFINFYYILL